MNECLYIGNDINSMIEAISQGWYDKKKKFVRMLWSVVTKCVFGTLGQSLKK